MKKLLFLILLMMPFVGKTQEIIVKSFAEVPPTLLGKSIGDIPKTNEGEDAAIVIVKVHRSDISFGGRLLRDGDNEYTYENGEYTLYVAPRSKSITIKIPGFNDERVHVADYAATIPNGLQSRRMYEMYIEVVPKSVLGGRNLSWGISGGYLMPMIKQSSDGINGSPINYGNGTAAEEANYKDAQGFVFGANVDFRLKDNIYLNAGLNFGQYRYRNDFSGLTTIYPISDANYTRKANSKYKESYLHSFVEIPVYVSYRFPTGHRGNVQVGIGPVINYGLSAKMKFYGIDVLSNGGELELGGDLRSLSYSGEFDLYSKSMQLNNTNNYVDAPPLKYTSNYTFDNSPLKRLNVAAGVYLGYEFHGVMLSVHYRYMLTNMANDGYWDNRLPLHLSPENYMSGVKISHNTLQIKIGYTLRY